MLEELFLYRLVSAKPVSYETHKLIVTYKCVSESLPGFVAEVVLTVNLNEFDKDILKEAYLSDLYTHYEYDI